MTDVDNRTDEQRWKDFEKCVNDANEPAHKAGLEFIKSALTLDLFGGAKSWVSMVRESARSGSNCMQHLTLAQREKVIERLREKQEDKLLTPKPKHL
ncbi:hypothetical protein [Rhizobium sp. Leaf383]|uniref:hypothetical protein n=1 Tax=Rhizobium sp. Leaf383 TaxID=1736357 RepID=UPI000712F830|nr:hypothetical protein [Rhizobium sp. Leaf383]KQS84281.1 hypothetical protein ASG58_21155 [Rhizobium sp. Leaf383]